MNKLAAGIKAALAALYRSIRAQTSLPQASKQLQLRYLVQTPTHLLFFIIKVE